MHLTERRYQDTASGVASEKSEATGAPVGKLGNETETAALRFGSHQDALDYVRHSVECANRRLASESLNAFDRYVKGEVAAYIGVKHRRTESQYHLVFRCIPAESVILKVADFTVPQRMMHIQVDGPLGRADFKGNEDEVFLGISNCVQGVKGVVPS
jgi:hypothetical protein